MKQFYEFLQSWLRAYSYTVGNRDCMTISQRCFTQPQTLFLSLWNKFSLTVVYTLTFLQDLTETNLLQYLYKYLICNFKDIESGKTKTNTNS